MPSRRPCERRDEVARVHKARVGLAGGPELPRGQALLVTPAVRVVGPPVHRQGVEVPRLPLLRRGLLGPARHGASLAMGRRTGCSPAARHAAPRPSALHVVWPANGLVQHRGAEHHGPCVAEAAGAPAQRAGAAELWSSNLRKQARALGVSEARLAAVLQHARPLVKGTHALRSACSSRGRLVALPGMAVHVDAVLATRGPVLGGPGLAQPRGPLVADEVGRLTAGPVMVGGDAGRHRLP
mmetsp:Transcript_108384/g.288446  ORF Transcript_108384/g.288446 Transcript_108384/m.288446 type:complete len:240 (+) Transcript_108384:39-758(+)